MPRAGAYEPVLSAKSIGFIYALPKAKQRKLIQLIFRLAEFPNQLGDYPSRDETDRVIQHLLVGELIVSFWPDHASKELRITEIDEV